MTNIYFKDEKFYLKSLSYLKGVTTIEIKRDLKRELRYQRLFLLSPDNYEVMDLAGRVGTINVSPNYDQAFVIVRLWEAKTTPQTYDEEDIRIIKQIIHYFCDIAYRLIKQIKNDTFI